MHLVVQFALPLQRKLRPPGFQDLPEIQRSGLHFFVERDAQGREGGGEFGRADSRFEVLEIETMQSDFGSRLIQANDDGFFTGEREFGEIGGERNMIVQRFNVRRKPVRVLCH